MRSRVAVALSVVLVLGSIGPLLGGTALVAGAASDGPAALPAAEGSTAGDAATEGAVALAQEQPEADNTVTRIDLQSDGTATWTIRFRTRLDTEKDVTEYREFQQTFRNNTSRYLDPFRERMTGVVANANESGDRKMAATEFAAKTTIQEVPRRWGVVRYEFTWQGFAAVDGDRVVVGDVFDGGFYIGDGDALKLAVPTGYVIAETAPDPDEFDDGVAIWYGREDFADGQPRFVAASEDAATSVDGAGDGADGEGGDGSGDSGGLFGVGIPFGVVALALLVALGIAWRRDALGGARDTIESGLAAVGSTLGGSGSAESKADRRESEPTAGSTATDNGGEGPAMGGVATQIVTDEDRVLDLLDERGGRVKQGDVAAALDWSKSKTSRVLSRMADADRIRKYQLGRENVIELPEEG